MTTTPYPIDAVITWVDGNDPDHFAKMASYRAEQDYMAEAIAPTRFRQVGEIDFAATSLLRFAPFVRRIHIVTDDQIPPIYLRAQNWPPALKDKIALVSHRELFFGYEETLPTFNSRSIETLLWRIRQLAEHFVYFNDDFFLLRPVTAEAWFDRGCPVLRGSWGGPPSSEKLLQHARRVLKGIVRRQKPLRPTHVRGQYRAARLAGFYRQCFYSEHAPNPLRRSTLENYFFRNESVLRRNLIYRFRHASQFNPIALANHLEIRSGSALLVDGQQCMYVDARQETPKSFAHLASGVLTDESTLFACIQSLDSSEPDCSRMGLGWLETVVGCDPVRYGGGGDAGAATDSA